MGIFGKMDALNIPTNPYYIAEGEYSAEVTNAQYKNNRDGEPQLVIEYTINDEASEFLDSKAFHYFRLIDPEMTLEAFDILPADEKKDIRRTMSSMKRTLCGNENNASQKGLGIAAEDLNDPEWDPAVLKGIKVNMGISNYGADKQGVNVRWVNLAE